MLVLLLVNNKSQSMEKKEDEPLLTMNPVSISIKLEIDEIMQKSGSLTKEDLLKVDQLEKRLVRKIVDNNNKQRKNSFFSLFCCCCKTK